MDALDLPTFGSGRSHCWVSDLKGVQPAPDLRATAAGGSYAPIPAKAGLAREVIKWLQSLDLSFSFKHVKQDFCNGYLVAEIFSWYYPLDIDINAFNNGVSFSSKLKNWSRLENFIFRRKLNIPKEFIHATMHSKPGGAECLIQYIYTLLTNRPAKLILDDEINFTSYAYQEKLPMVARSTVANAIQNNLKLTEVLERPDQFTNKQKVLNIIDLHMQLRQLARQQNPKHFNVKPTLGEQATRLSHPQYQYDCVNSTSKQNASQESTGKRQFCVILHILYNKGILDYKVGKLCSSCIRHRFKSDPEAGEFLYQNSEIVEFVAADGSGKQIIEDI